MPPFKRVKESAEMPEVQDGQASLHGNSHTSRCALRSACRTPTHKRTLAREMWLLLIVLVTQSLADVVNFDNALSTELIANVHDFTSKPTLKDDYIFSSYYESMHTPKAGAFIQFADLSEGITSSSGDSTDHSDPSEEEDEREMSKAQSESVLSQVSALVSSSSSSARRRLFTYDENVWQQIYSFLPWQCVMQIRGISRFHFRQSMGFASVLRMPMSKLPAIFIPCREDLDTDEMAIEAALQLPSGPWDCSRCGSHNAGSRSLCSNYQCQAGRQLKGSRLFMGQLRRSGTVPMVKWIVNYVLNAPKGSLMSVENRRNTQNQRGKGCAWPTVADDATVSRLLDSHHRMFFDAVGGVEGVWVVPKGHEADLAKETDMRPSKQHQKHLPRGPMAIELPEGASHPAQPALSQSNTTPRTNSASLGFTVSTTPRSTTSDPQPLAEWHHPMVVSAGNMGYAYEQGLYDTEYCYPYRYYDVVNGIVFDSPTTYRWNPYSPIQQDPMGVPQ